WCHAYGTEVTGGNHPVLCGADAPVRRFLTLGLFKGDQNQDQRRRRAVSASHDYTWRTSPSRATISYRTGFTKKPMNRREIKPATMTIANGFWVSDPMPDERAAGNKPRHATRAVIMIGLSRNREASRVAVRMSIPSCLSLF